MNFNIQYTVYTYILILYTGYIILYQIMMLNDVKGKHSSLQICIHVELHTHTHHITSLPNAEFADGLPRC